MSKKLLVVFACLGIFFMAHDVVRSQQDSLSWEEEMANFTVNRVVKTIDGARFVVEPDRPIEKVNGIYRPVGIERYFTFKLEKLELKMNESNQALERKLEKKIEDLAEKQQALEQKLKEAIRPQIPQASNATIEEVAGK
ncbi:MAG: hypothetical protein V1863_04005 [Candidatus Omnitrophota bacterium]